MPSTALKEFSPETEINIHKNIRFHPQLSHGEKLFYAEIDSMSRDKRCSFSARRMSQIFHVSHQTIINWVKKLIDLDMIEIRVDFKKHDRHQYIITKCKNKT